MSNTACITGATSGIGLATAQRFAREGWNVIATGRRTERLDALAASFPGKVLPLGMDVQNKDAVFAAFKSLNPPFDTVDLLVNNAGLALGLEPAHLCNMDDWETMVDTNIKGLFVLHQALLPKMVARGQGHVVNIGSIAGSYAYPGGNVYGATKSFVEMFSRNLRCDLHGSGIRVTNVEPGLLETEFSVVRFKGDTHSADNVYKDAKPLHADDIAEIIWWVNARPAHVNICSVEVMPTCQSNGGTRTWTGK